MHLLHACIDWLRWNHMSQIASKLMSSRPGQRNVLIIGSSSAGKTSLLAVCQLATDKADVGLRYTRFLPKNDAMARLAALARETIKSRYLPTNSSTGISEYQFDLEIANDSFWTRFLDGPSHKKSFRFVDGPGGALLRSERQREHTTGDEHLSNAFRQKLVQDGRDSQALVLCVDSSDESRTADFFIDLPELLSHIAYPEPKLKFQQIVILLTKAECYFEHFGPRAFAIAQQSNPWERLMRLLTPTTLQALLNMTDPKQSEIVCGWVSAYGFVPQTGYANWDPKTNRMRTCLEGQPLHLLNNWFPFRIMDPLVYLTVGEIGALELLPR
jgi:hypothetical protein